MEAILLPRNIYKQKAPKRSRKAHSILFYVPVLHFCPPAMIATVSLANIKTRMVRNQERSNLSN